MSTAFTAGSVLGGLARRSSMAASALPAAIASRARSSGFVGTISGTPRGVAAGLGKGPADEADLKPGGPGSGRALASVGLAGTLPRAASGSTAGAAAPGPVGLVELRAVVVVGDRD